MDNMRRSLIKGMLGGGTLLALGVPGMTPAVIVTQSARSSLQHSCLFLGNTALNEAFMSGAHAAWLAYTPDQQGILPVAELEDILLDNPFGAGEAFRQFHPIRCIAIMDEANAAILTELIRTIDGQLLSLGFHHYTPGNAHIPLRHSWTTASPDYSTGELLASILSQNQPHFSIVENFLVKPASQGTFEGHCIAGFRSYRPASQWTRHLHCTGLFPDEADELLGWKTASPWQPLSSRPFPDDVHEISRMSAIALGQLKNWVEMTSFALVATALGVRTYSTACAKRAYVCRSTLPYQQQPTLAGTHFVSFIFDV